MATWLASLPWERQAVLRGQPASARQAQLVPREQRLLARPVQPVRGTPPSVLRVLRVPRVPPSDRQAWRVPLAPPWDRQPLDRRA